MRLFLLLLSLAAAARAEPRGRAADESAWARLTERVRLRPTKVETLSVGASEYEVSVVTVQAAAFTWHAS